jgi:uncharacterized protein
MTEQPEWAGFIRTGARVEFVRVDGSLTAQETVRVDLPGRGVFGLTGTVTAEPYGQISIGATLAGEPVSLTGTSDGERFAAEQVELRRVAVWDTAGYRRLSARYAVGVGRHISVHAETDDWSGSPLLMYAEGDRVVRLYPDAGGTLVSEAGEVFTLMPGRDSIESMRAVSGDGPAERVTRLSAWTDEDVSIEGPGGRLSGTLMTPPGPGPWAAVVLIHGAAGGRRDVYRLFGEHFVQAGLAALVYDRRGRGESAGDPELTFADKSRDAEAWVDYLQSRPGIQPDRVGVWGFSNGSWVAPMVAARRPDVAFVAVIGASGTTAAETEIYRRVFDLREQGVPEDQIDLVAGMWRLVYRLLVSRRPDAQDAARFDDLAARVAASPELARVKVQEYAIQNPFLGPVPPYRSYQEVADEVAGEPDEADTFTVDPVDSYRSVGVPVLFAVGEFDSNLSPLDSARRVSRALHEAGNHDATVLVFPNTGHTMNYTRPGMYSGMTSEQAGYRFHNFRFAGGFLDIVRSWAAARAGRR